MLLTAWVSWLTRMELLGWLGRVGFWWEEVWVDLMWLSRSWEVVAVLMASSNMSETDFLGGKFGKKN